LLVGDVDQLPSVGPGKILRDIIDSGVAAVTVLDEVFRQAQESGIVMNALRINRGEMPAFGTYDDFQFVEADSDAAVRMVTGGVFRALEKRGFDLLRDVQVVTPMKKGDAGTEALNRAIQQRLNPKQDDWEPEYEMKSGLVFRQRDRVMQIRNDYERDVFNGDLGFIVSVEPHAKRITVDFGDTGIPKVVEYAFGELLENIMHSFAVTIHKVQGAEYPAVVMVLTNSHYVMLERNLLYTGVTRARSLFCIVGQKGAIAQAVKNDRPVLRNTRLRQRIQDGMPEPEPAIKKAKPAAKKAKPAQAAASSPRSRKTNLE
ncbi:MAG: ATP-binding domain-containing protein, partial [Desulfobacterales bacterium]|nr:ATP-binding domain-containing protein [Desulfobacterales bacterium]